MKYTLLHVGRGSGEPYDHQCLEIWRPSVNKSSCAEIAEFGAGFGALQMSADP